jgi:rhodanese-related sulfurtransferase
MCVTTMKQLAWISLSCVCTLAHAAPYLSAPATLDAAQAGEIRVIDIRTPAEWRETGVVPGAGRVDFYRGPDVLTQYILREVGGDKNAPIALICRTGNRTTHAQKYLQSQGFTRVYNVKEGMRGSVAGPGWLKRGLPVESCAMC